MRIRELFPSETALVAQFYREAPDYWLMAEGRSNAAIARVSSRRR